MRDLTSPICSGLRQICQAIYDSVSQRFPNTGSMLDEDGVQRQTAAQMGVGGFLFLRFFCPAIMTPESFGFLPSKIAVRL